MTYMIIFERFVAVLCLCFVVLKILTTIESIKIAHHLGVKWETTFEFTTVAAFILSISTLVRWVWA